MRIAYIGIKGLPSKAGADRVVEAIVQRLSDEHEITVYCSSSVVPPETKYPGVELVRMPVIEGKHSHATSLFFMSALHALTRNYDLIHLHNVEAGFVVPLLKLKYKVISTSHGYNRMREKWGNFAKFLFRFAIWPVRFSDSITTVSKYQVESNERQFGREVLYIPNGVDLDDEGADLVKARELLKTFQVDVDCYILFAAGRIIPTKGAADLLEAYMNLTTNYKLIMVGDASHVPEYEEKIHQIADSRVVFIPFVEKSVLLGLAQLAHLFVFPSTIEAMSMMLLEAASQGVPIISSDIPDNISVLPHHALFFKSGDVSDLYDKLDWALQHPEEMQALGIGAKSWVEGNYQWDLIVANYDRIYHAVAD